MMNLAWVAKAVENILEGYSGAPPTKGLLFPEGKETPWRRQGRRRWLTFAEHFLRTDQPV